MKTKKPLKNKFSELTTYIVDNSTSNTNMYFSAILRIKYIVAYKFHLHALIEMLISIMVNIAKTSYSNKCAILNDIGVFGITIPPYVTKSLRTHLNRVSAYVIITTKQSTNGIVFPVVTSMRLVVRIIPFLFLFDFHFKHNTI